MNGSALGLAAPDAAAAGRAVSRTQGARSVFSALRGVVQPVFERRADLPLNERICMDGLTFLAALPARGFPAAFLDPQYRGVLDHLSYGNEDTARSKRRAALPQMTDEIPEFVRGIERVLIPSGHLFLWVDKFHLCTGIHEWLQGSGFSIVDMITWHKGRLGMGYRSRRTSEHLLVLQKPPRKAKGVWTSHNIPDVWSEKTAGRGGGVHPKPVGLQAALISAVTNPGDIVIDPAAGSFTVREACRDGGRNFLGCDING